MSCKSLLAMWIALMWSILAFAVYEEFFAINAFVACAGIAGCLHIALAAVERAIKHWSDV